MTSDQTWLAVAEVRRAPSGVGLAAVVLYLAESAVEESQTLAPAPPGQWDEQPTWSKDDRFLVFLRQTGGGSSAIDGRGRSLNGRIHLVVVTGDGDGRVASRPIDSGLVGGQITWLP
jgi:hypothetical protein